MGPSAKPHLRITSSWDDGNVLDIYLASLLKTYGIPGVFYLPSNGGLEPEHIRRLDAIGFEIGGHTVNHPQDLKLLNDEHLQYEIGDNKHWLQSILDKEITKFCYPRGRYDERVIEAVKQAGYESARTTTVLRIDNYFPYETSTTIHVYQRAEYEDISWFEVAKTYAKWASESQGLFHIWGHSWEIDRDNNWFELEKLFRWLNDNFELIAE